MNVWETLQSIKDNGPVEHYYGICSNFVRMSDVWSDLLDVWEDNHQACFKAWDEFSGSIYYPIPGYDDQTPYEAFDLTDGAIMWDRNHEYGAARWRLLDHCIEWFKNFETNPQPMV